MAYTAPVGNLFEVNRNDLEEISMELSNRAADQRQRGHVAQTDASGTATPDIPGTNGLGQLRQGTLEASNVEPVQELIDLITTQRSFELNSQMVQAGDQILQLIANLRRF